MTTYISSVAFLDYKAEELVNFCSQEFINLEFSSGLDFHPQMENYFLDYPHKKLAHNYFPAPEIPFVLNLASDNRRIRESSVEHCLECLELTKKAGAPFYAAHAGFCIDPNPQELGRKLIYEKNINKKLHWELFIKAVKIIIAKAEFLGVDFYIENNVIANFNLDTNGFNPLLCCDDVELLKLVEEIDHPRFGILLDTAHFKVSGSTMNFDIDIAIQKLEKFIKAIHHSDNNGLIDSNQPITNEYWFLKHLDKFKNIDHVLEVKRQTLQELQAQELILNQLFS